MTGTPGCAVVTAGPGTTDAVTGVANAFRAESPMLLIGGQGALSQHKMGSLQDLPHVDMMTPITKFAASVPATARVADMVSMAFRECYNGAPGPSFLEIPRDVLDAKVPVSSARVPAAGRYRASTRAAGDPAAIERLADLLVHAERPCVLLGSQVWTCRGTDAARELVRTLNVPAYMNGAGRGTLPPGDPHHFQLSRRHAFNERRRHRHRRHAVRLPHGVRPAALTRRHGRPDRPRLPYGRQEPRRRPRHRRRRGPGPVRPSPRPPRAACDDGAARRKPWLEELRAEETKAQEKRLPLLHSDQTPIHPYRLVSEINEFLTEDTIYIGDGGDIVTFSGQVVQPQVARPLDGPGTARHARRRHPVRAGRQARAAGQGGRSRSSATARSA